MDTNDQAPVQKRDPAGRLGTFAGVFTPSILTILGIILFMRLGYVVGQAGFVQALFIIALANSISLLTTFSLAAIATNYRVKGGGDYYLISRTLGLEFGGAIGTVLFLAQTISIAFYAIGFGEAVAFMLSLSSVQAPRLIAWAATGLLFILAWMGADWATRFQYVVMAALGFALLSFMIGGLNTFDLTTLKGNLTPSRDAPEFWLLFAIFFPAVTGFTQGVSMSGDLKDPGRALPRGTFAAVILSLLIYLASALLLAGCLPQATLVGDYAAMKRVATFGILINVGVIAATLSSAMASFMGAPRILQSMGRDKIFPGLSFFARGSDEAGNPRRGVVLCAGIAGTTIALGNLNIIAPVVSMFFLISYGLLNYATYYEIRSSSPSFRPRFTFFDKRLSLAGALGSFGIMLAIDFTAAVLALCVLFVIYQYLKRSEHLPRWADSSRSFHLQQVRDHIRAAASEQEHPRDWRPFLLAFSDEPHRRRQLLQFAAWLEGGSGITTAVRIIEGDGVRMLKLRAEAEEELRRDIEQQGLSAFPLVVAAPQAQQALHTLIQGYGIGPLKVNTALLNWLEPSPFGISTVRELRYGQSLRTAFRLGCNLIILDATEEEWLSLETLSAGKRRIDVWWQGDATSRLMLLLAYLMTRSDDWEQASIRMLAFSRDDKPPQGTQRCMPAEPLDGTPAPGRDGAPTETLTRCLDEMLNDIRIQAHTEIVLQASPEDVLRLSADAALVMLPLRLYAHQPLDPFGGPLDELLARLPITALVLAAEDVDLEAGPEDEHATRRANALDKLKAASKREKLAEREALTAAQNAEERIHSLQDAMLSAPDEEHRQQAEKEALAAAEFARSAARKAAKAKAKHEAAIEEARALGVYAPEGEPRTDE